MSGEVYLALCLKCGQQVMAVSVPNAPDTCLSRVLPLKKYCKCPREKCDSYAFIADGTFPGLVATLDFGPKGNTLKEIFAEILSVANSNPSSKDIKSFLEKHKILKRVKRFFPLDAPSLLAYISALMWCYDKAEHTINLHADTLGSNVVVTVPECLAEIEKAIERENPTVEKKKQKHPTPLRMEPDRRSSTKRGSFTLKFPTLTPNERAILLKSIMVQLPELE